MSKPNLPSSEDLKNILPQLSGIQIKCSLHQTLNKYYLKSENRFVCEYDGFDKDGPDNFLHMPQILEIYREEILHIQKNPQLLHKTKIDELIPIYLNKVKKMNIDTTKLNQEVETFKEKICEKVMFILRSNANLAEIKELLNEVNFTSDGKPDLKKIGMNEQKEQNLIFLAQFLIFRDNAKTTEKNLLDKFTYFLEEFQKKVVDIAFNGIDLVDMGYSPFQDEVAKIENRKEGNKSQKDYLKSHIISRKDYDQMVLQYEDIIRRKDIEIRDLTDKLGREKTRNVELEHSNYDLNEKVRLMTVTIKDQENNLKGRIAELEGILLSLRNENEDLRKNQLKKHFDEINGLKNFYENQINQMKQNHDMLMSKYKHDHEKGIADLKNENDLLQNHYSSMNTLVSSSIDDLNNKRVKELEQILAEERKKYDLIKAENDKKLADLNNKLLEFAKTNEALQKRILSLETENKDLKAQRDMLAIEINNLRKTLKEKEDILLKLIEEDKGIRIHEKQTNENLLTRINELEKLNLKYKKEFAEMEDYRKYFDMYINIKKDYERNLIELENNKNKNIYLAKENESMKHDYEEIIKNLNAQLLDFKTKYEGLISENVLVTQQSALKNNKLVAIQKAFSNLNTKLKDNPIGLGLNNSMLELSQNLNNNSLVSLGNRSIDFNVVCEGQPNKSNTDYRGLLMSEENKTRNLENDLASKGKKNHELEEELNVLRLKVKSLEENYRKLQLVNSELTHQLNDLKKQKSNGNSHDPYHDLLDKDVTMKSLETKLVETQETLFETHQENEFLKKKIKTLLHRLDELNKLILNFSPEQRAQILLSVKNNPVEFAQLEKDFANIDFIENDLLSLLLLNRNNFPLMREWLLPLSRNSLGLNLNNENNCNLNFRLLYKASLHGFEVKQFITRCHKIRNTLVVAHTSHGKLIGGFTPIPWNLPNDDELAPFYCSDEEGKTFLFSFNLKRKFNLKNRDLAILCSCEMGPVFGGGSDLEIVDKCNENINKYSDFGFSFDSENVSKEAFYGAENYLVKDYEVYEVML